MKETKIILVFISILFFWNCNHEPFEQQQELEAASKILSNIKQEDITFNEIKNDTYLNSILKKASKNIKQNESISHKNTQSIFNFELSHQVRKYVAPNYVSYTIPVINSYGSSYVFQNIVIEKDVLRDAVYLVTYYPDENYQESIRKGLVGFDNNIDFTGSQKFEYLYYKRKVNIDERKTAKNIEKIAFEDEIDEPLIVCVETYAPKKCTAGGNHYPGQSCDGTPSQQPSWIVSTTCTNGNPRPSMPAAPPPPPIKCNGCPVGTDNIIGSTGSNDLPPVKPSPDWTPQYICTKYGSNGQCNQMIPYTPILTIPMTNPHNYYTANTRLSHEEINLLLRVEYHEAKKSIDFYLNNNINPIGGRKETTEFVDFAFNFFKENPDTTFDEFHNWFMATPEGNDGGDVFDKYDYDGVEVQKQSLPERNTFYNAFPKNGTAGMKSNDVYKLVGGHMYQENKNPEDRNYKNACAIRVSRGLNYSGRPIPVFRNKEGKQKSEKGDDGLNYILDASSLLAYMLKAYSDSSPIHLKDKTAVEYEKALNGKWGIYIMVPKNSNTFGASGHADFFSQSGCLSNCYFQNAAEVYFWELK